MSGPYLKHLTVQGFGCVQMAHAEMTRLHAFIGPNDSGKTTLMRALRTALQFSSGVFSLTTGSGSNGVEPFDPGVGPRDQFRIEITTTDAPEGGCAYSIGQLDGSGALQEVFSINGSVVGQKTRDFWMEEGVLAERPRVGGVSSETLLRKPPLWLHLSPSAMRGSSRLFSEDEAIALDETASRLPAVYDAILNRGDDTFLRITDEVRQFFPPIKRIRLKVVGNDTKAFEIELVSGQKVPASFISDGVLYYLAFAALEHISPPSVVLIEEPENGLHPTRIADVMKVLRRLSERTQIILATHSPLVINELQGDEVSVVTRPGDRGTQIRRLCDTPNFEERSKVYALGELWVSYADGKNEEPLLSEVEGDP